MNNNDRRVKKTKIALRFALAELMAEKDLRSITVQELTTKADVHRATFYSHYHDLYELYDELKEVVLRDVAFLFDSAKGDFDSIYDLFVEFVSNNADFFRSIISPNTQSGQIMDQICEVIENKYYDLWMEDSEDDVIPEEVRYITTYHVRGVLAVINKWVNLNYSIPKEDVVKLLRKTGEAAGDVAVHLKRKQSA